MAAADPDLIPIQAMSNFGAQLAPVCANAVAFSENQNFVHVENATQHAELLLELNAAALERLVTA